MSLKILYLTGHPAEANLSAPIIRRLRDDPYFEVEVYNCLEKPMLHSAFTRTVWDAAIMKADVVVSPCDRREILEPTIEAFFSNKVIVRLYAGINTSGGTHDDVIRRMLDSMGHILFVESEECKQNLIRQGEEPWRIHVSGITHLDDITIEPVEPLVARFAMFLMNPCTVSESETVAETNMAIRRAQEFVDTGGYVQFYPPNGDQFSSYIQQAIRHFAEKNPNLTVPFIARLPRGRFLWLLSKCDLFISNSSATHYEFPALNKSGEVYNPSWRNKKRTQPPLEPGGSDRIVHTLKSIDWTDRERLLRKRFS